MTSYYRLKQYRDVECAECGGTGKCPEEFCDGYEGCGTCDGLNICPECDGSGVLPEEESA